MCPLKRHDPWIAAQSVGELSMAHVQSIDAGRTAAQQYIRKAARRSTYIETGSAGNIDPERVERASELLAAARDVRPPIRHELQRKRGVDELTRLEISPRAVAYADPDLPGEYQTRRPVAILGEPAVNEQVVEPHTRRASPNHLREVLPVPTPSGGGGC
jgi:hypothetical protein